MAEMEGQSLTQAMGLTQEEVARRKQFRARRQRCRAVATIA